MEDYQIGLIIFGFVFLIIFLLIVLKKKNKYIYLIKKITSCKDGICSDYFRIQGVDYDFKNYDEAKRYALSLKENEK